MSWRQKMAWWIDPQSMLIFDAYRRLRADIENDRQWLAEFPEVFEELTRLLGRHEPGFVSQPDIGKFRDQLRGKRLSRRLSGRRPAAADAELVRVWTKVEAIRAKQAAKPKHSPLPGPSVAAKMTEADRG